MSIKEVLLAKGEYEIVRKLEKMAKKKRRKNKKI